MDATPAQADTTKPKAFLNGTQERLADLIGEMIISGGTRGNLLTLVEIALDHEGRRFYTPLMTTKPAAQLEKDVSDHIERHASKWYDNLAAARASRKELPEEVRPEPKTISDTIRANRRELLEERFKDFMGDANPEEITFLGEVLSWHTSMHSTWGNGYESLYIANAFELEIGRNREYVRTPPHLTEAVEEYIKVMLKANPGSKAA